MSETISLGARLSQLAAQRPDRPAVTDQSRTLTWGELDRRTNRLARGLAAAGVKLGDLVTVGMPNSADFIEVCYGLWKVGATPQPISCRLPAAEAEAVMDLANTPILIAGDSIDSPRPRFDLARILALSEDDSPVQDTVCAGLEGADLWRLDRAAEADLVWGRGCVHTGRRQRLSHRR